MLQAKYRCFVAYYLICHQAIILTVYSLNSSYYNTAFYLQAVCIIIAIIHVLIQPYQSGLLNALDGAVLLLMIQASAYVAVDDSTFLIVEMIVMILPKLLFSAVVIRKIIMNCNMKKKLYRYNHINNADIARYGYQ